MSAAAAQASADAQLQTPDAEPPAFAGALFWVAVAFSAFQIVTAAFSPLSSSVVRGVHVGFLLLVTFVLYPPARQRWLGWGIGAAGFATGIYQWVFEADLVQRAGELTRSDMVIGVVVIALVFEAARRIMGWALPLVCGTFLLKRYQEESPGCNGYRTP